MDTTEIINRTTSAMDIKVSTCSYSVKLTTVAKNESYIVRLNYTDTYREFTLGGIDASGKARGKVVIVSSDECVDNKIITIREVEGKFQVEMEPKARPTLFTKTDPAAPVACEIATKRPSLFWRLLVF